MKRENCRMVRSPCGARKEPTPESYVRPSGEKGRAARMKQPPRPLDAAEPL